jgi:hypothetical protein
MVEASEEKLDEGKEDLLMKEDSKGTEAAESAANETENDSFQGWTQLMGENIQMRVSLAWMIIRVFFTMVKLILCSYTL